jgi:hypothetical protein
MRGWNLFAREPRHRYETRAAARLRRSPIVCERDRAIWARGYHVGAAKTKIYKDNFQEPVAVRVRLFFSTVQDTEKAGFGSLLGDETDEILTASLAKEVGLRLA